MCEYQNEHSCSECPFITCNNHPQFYLALLCAMKSEEPERDTTSPTR